MPIICTVRFGTPLPRMAEEDKAAFLERARDAVIELAGNEPLHHKLYWLIGGVVALLIVASVIGRILRARVKDEKAAAVVDNLIARMRAWWLMVGGVRRGVPARPQRDDCAVRVHLVLRAARILDADADAARRSPRAVAGVFLRVCRCNTC